jgi:hypothetical protein
LQKKQAISLEWLFDGDLRAHPRGAVAREPASHARQGGKLQEFREALSGLDDRRLELLFRHFESLADGTQQREAPAPIGQKAQPAAAGVSCKTDEAVNKRGAGSGPRLNPVNITRKGNAAGMRV